MSARDAEEANYPWKVFRNDVRHEYLVARLRNADNAGGSANDLEFICTPNGTPRTFEAALIARDAAATANAKATGSAA